MNVGEYVRTKDYGFIKVKSFYYNENMIHILDENYNEYDFSKKLVDDFKSSPNIIDLIERFDLVNGHLVICKMYEDEKDIPTIIKCVGDYYFKEEDIKSIVTREMFERMEYKVGE